MTNIKWKGLVIRRVTYTYLFAITAVMAQHWTANDQIFTR